VEVVPRVSADDMVDNWRFLFEDLYDAAEDSAGERDPRLVGWTDGLTGQPVPEEHMREWVETTVERVRSLRPRRILEIGAGTGLVMSELIADTGLEEYVATDLSPASVQLLSAIGGRAGERTRVRVHRGAAHEPLPASRFGGYDTVVLNSVVQYFPSVDYLESVLSAAIELTVPGGHLFLGDVRDATLLETYYRRRAGSTKALDVEGCRRRDFELSLSPDYLRSLRRRFDRVTAVEAAPEQGRARNEMTVFRFDSVLHLGCPPPTPPTEARATAVPAEAVRAHLETGRGPKVWTNLANARLDGQAREAVDPELFRALDGTGGWKVRVGCDPGHGPGRLEVWAVPPGADGEHFGTALPCRNDPVELGQELLPPGSASNLLEALYAYSGVVAAEGTPTIRFSRMGAHGIEQERC
jgi:SAM-dependent methyltransferase